MPNCWRIACKLKPLPICEIYKSVNGTGRRLNSLKQKACPTYYIYYINVAYNWCYFVLLITLNLNNNFKIVLVSICSPSGDFAMIIIEKDGLLSCSHLLLFLFYIFFQSIWKSLAYADI